MKGIVGGIFFIILIQACSPMPRASYGLIADVKESQDLNDMKIDIKVGNLLETTYRCNAEAIRRGEYLRTLFAFPFTLGLTGGCVWVGGYSKGKIDFCYGYSTEYNLAHEMEHCRGYKDHPLLGCF